MSLNIIGTGHCVPELKISNSDLEKFLETSDEWITTRTGIGNRRISQGETLSDLSYNAAASALNKAGLDACELDLIICATLQGDYITPSLACVLQAKLGAKCPAFDINAACSGFIYSLEVASTFITAGKANNILIVCAEMMSNIVDWSDRRTCVLFGDGAGACVVTKGDALKYIHVTAEGNTQPIFLNTHYQSTPFGNTKENAPEYYLYMNGQDVFKFAVSMVEKESKLAFETLGISSADIDYYLLHQANKRIIDSARTRLKLPEEKFPINIHKYGNTSCASIPILLDEMSTEGRLHTGQRIMLMAFGGGLTSGTCVIDWA